MERYYLQEMKISGYTFYEIIDTENGCATVFSSFDYSETINKLNDLN